MGTESLYSFPQNSTILSVSSVRPSRVLMMEFRVSSCLLVRASSLESYPALMILAPVSPAAFALR